MLLPDINIWLASFELATFDKGFAQYKSLHCTILS
jgi:hypothetical protein